MAQVPDTRPSTRAAVPDTYPTTRSAYPQTSPTAYPDTKPATRSAYDWDPGMWRGTASDHRGRSVHAGKRTTQVSRDPEVNYLATRKPTVPSIISRQGVKETANRYGLELASGALGYAAGAGAGFGKATGDVARNMVQSENVGHGIMGTIAGAAIGYGIMRADRKRQGS